MRSNKSVSCCVGDSLYIINCLWVTELIVMQVTSKDVYYEVIAEDGDGNMYSYYAEDFGKTVFVDKRSAEGLLKRMRRNSCW